MISLILACLVGTNAQEVMYVDGYQSITCIDPQSGVVSHTVPLSGFPDVYGMTHDGGRLLAIERNPYYIGHQLISLHPADRVKTTIGPVGEQWNIAALELDPISGVLYAAHINALYEVNQVTGKATWIGRIQGLKQFDCVCGLAIDAQGNAVAIGVLGYALYSLDLPALTATHLGDLPFTSGSVTDAAFDSSGGLWATWSPSNFSLPGVYKVDMANLSVSHFFEIGTAGLAIGPATPETAYCTPKTNSLACVPTLSAVGLASPTASSGYDVTVIDVLNDTNGRLLYTLAGSASNPFGGGTLCVSSPWKATSITKSGGSAKPNIDCTGVWTADLNTQLASRPGPQAGDTIYCQWMGRDPGFPAPDNYSLSSALAFTLLP